MTFPGHYDAIEKSKQSRRHADLIMRKGGHGADARNFIDGIPKTAFFLAGIVAYDLLHKGRK